VRGVKGLGGVRKGRLRLGVISLTLFHLYIIL
jgi:hypothetical protein